MEAVLDLVEQIPPGRVASYGDIADYLGSGGPRQVGTVMSRYGDAVCWWRVVRADGRPAAGLVGEALSRLRGDGTPVRNGRVEMSAARWHGPLDAGLPPTSNL